MKTLNKDKTELNPLAQSEAIPVAVAVESSNEAINVHPVNSILESFDERKSFKVLEAVSAIELEGKNLAEIMQNTALKIDTIKSSISNFGELTNAERAQREAYRSALADHITNYSTSDDLHREVQYGDKKMSMLEFAAELNLGPKTMQAMLDKASFSKKTLEKTLEITKEHRAIEKTSNYRQSIQEIGGSVATGAADGFLEVPGGAIVGGDIGLVTGAIEASVNPVGETVAKKTKALLKDHIREFIDKHKDDVNKPKIEIEMTNLNTSKTKAPSSHSR